MTDTAIIYASDLGKHVEKTAKYLAGRLNADTFDIKKQTKINMEEYSNIIFGSFVHFGKPSSKIVAFSNENKEELAEKNVSLFICCLLKDEKGAKQCEKAASLIGVSDATFFPDSGDKNDTGVNSDVDAFIERFNA